MKNILEIDIGKKIGAKVYLQAIFLLYSQHVCKNKFLILFWKCKVTLDNLNCR